jgi:hypothetical protein
MVMGMESASIHFWATRSAASRGFSVSLSKIRTRRPQPSHGVNITNNDTQAPGNFCQYQIANLMTVGVVDGLEPINVKEQQCQPPTAALYPTQLVFKLLVDQSSIRQAGERVVMRHGFQTLFLFQQAALQAVEAVCDICDFVGGVGFDGLHRACAFCHVMQFSGQQVDRLEQMAEDRKSTTMLGNDSKAVISRVFLRVFVTGSKASPVACLATRIHCVLGMSAIATSSSAWLALRSVVMPR